MDARTAMLDMRERCAELAETKARDLRTHAKNYPNSHYGRGLEDTAREMDKLAGAIRQEHVSATVQSDQRTHSGETND